ncbi:MAG TPA: hypothetical protein VG456_19445 [Candidatus Sulfopaludibacter sp.]|nr:hypothetical protein [Candidatus Sulfopaludibacter sp.]
MLRASLVAIPALLLCACDRLPETFTVPVQRTALPAAPSISMSDPHAGEYLAQGFREHSEGPWRWAHDHPVLRFHLPRMDTATFHMTFTQPDSTFQLIGPLTLTVLVNGHAIDRARFDKPGEQQYTHEVAVEYLKPDAVNLVAIEPDKTATPNPGEKLSFVLLRAGFTE